jgi:hypothetical protein
MESKVPVCQKTLLASGTRAAGNTRQSIFNQLHYRWANQAGSDFQRT